MTTLQLPEGMTVRKVGNSLKVVPMRKRRVAIVKEKAMLQGIRREVCGRFDMLRSLRATAIEASQPFTAEEMYEALKSVSGDFPLNQRRVQSCLTTLCTHMGDFELIEMPDGKYTQYSDELYNSLERA